MNRDSMDIDETPDTYFEDPEPTSNNLGDVLHWLKQGDRVVLHCNERYESTWHACHKQAGLETKNRTIYINVGRNWVSLLNDDEWFWYIKNAGYQRCNCDKPHSDKTYHFVMNH